MAIPLDLERVLDAVVPSDAQEEAALAVMRGYAAQLPEPLSSKQPEAHFTGSALVTDGARVALVFHRKLAKWLQPGGHAEPADAGSLSQTALREALEETGLSVRLHPTAPRPLDVDVHRIPERPGAPAHLHLDVRFLAVADGSNPLVGQASEVADLRWFTFEEALQHTDDASLRRLLHKAQASLAPAGADSSSSTPR